MTANAGVATFAGCKITGTAGTYSLSATGDRTELGHEQQLHDHRWHCHPAGLHHPARGRPERRCLGRPAKRERGGRFRQRRHVVRLQRHAQHPTASRVAARTFSCGANPVTAGSGVATFTGCQISGAIGNYTLKATSTTPALTGTSASFTITIGAPAKLAFTTQPGGGIDGVAWTGSARGERRGRRRQPHHCGDRPDHARNRDQPRRRTGLHHKPVRTPAAAWPPSPAARSRARPGTYTLTASEPGLTSATSSTFAITIGPATKLTFTTQPGGGANAATWTTQPQVAVQDVGGNTVNSTTSITLALGTNPGGTLACTTNPLAATGGTSSFAGCKITGKAGSYTLTAAATGLTGTTSTAFTITAGPATQLVFTTQPGGGADGGNLDHPAGRERGGPVGQRGDHRHQLRHPRHRDQPRRHAGLHHQPARRHRRRRHLRRLQDHRQAGQLHPDRLGHRLDRGHEQRVHHHRRCRHPARLHHPARRRGQRGDLDRPSLRWPSRTPAATSSRRPRTPSRSAIGTNPGGTLACTTNPLAATGRRRHLRRLQDHRQDGELHAEATATGLAGTTSNRSPSPPGTATQLVFTTQPGGGANGATWTTQPAVTVEDQSGNMVTTATNSVTLAVGTNPGGTLACTTNPLAATGGTSTFAGCKITGKAGTYTLTAAATGLTGPRARPSPSPPARPPSSSSPPSPVAEPTAPPGPPSRP